LFEVTNDAIAFDKDTGATVYDLVLQLIVTDVCEDGIVIGTRLEPKGRD